MCKCELYGLAQSVNFFFFSCFVFVLPNGGHWIIFFGFRSIVTIEFNWYDLQHNNNSYTTTPLQLSITRAKFTYLTHDL